MTNNEAIGILAIVVETAKGRCFVTDEAISDAYAMAISALQEQEELYVYSQCKTCRYYHDDDDVRCMICDDENDMYEGQEAKTQLSREDTTLGVQKTCVTCKHYPESKWPCIDCDMRNPANRWEPQELSKNSPELDKENGELHPTCTGSCTGSEELKQEAKHSNELSSTQKALDTISRQAAIDELKERIIANGYSNVALVSELNRSIGYLMRLPSAQPTLQPTCNNLATDTISRQAAISELMEWVEKEKNKSWSPFKGLFHWTGIKAMLECLPSAQPEMNMDEWCTDCKEYDHEKHCCPRWNRVIRQALKDAQPEPQWIPVEEHLPKQNEMVLITIIRKDERYNKIPFISIGYISWSNTVWWCAHDGDCKSANVEVLAWRPLPEPYRAERRTDE